MKKGKTYIHIVPEDFEGNQRLRLYAKGLFPYLETNSSVKKAIANNQIKLNGKIGKTGDWVTAGCEISYELMLETSKERAELVEVLYEDRDLMIVRKPPGISSSGNSRSLQQRLQGINIEDYDGSLPFPFLVHRLDKATEGLLIAAKNIETRRLLATMLEEHSIIKDYVCIVEGKLVPSLKWIVEAIDDKPAKTEIINSEELNTKDSSSRVIVRLHSGRTHQIRRHFQGLNHPIVGDSIYNKEGLNFRTGLLLCAFRIEFIHPITHHKVDVNCPIPSKIDKYDSIKKR